MKKTALISIAIVFVLLTMCSMTKSVTKMCVCFLSDNTIVSTLLSEKSIKGLNTEMHLVKNTYIHRKRAVSRANKGKLAKTKPLTKKQKKSTKKRTAAKRKKTKKTKRKKKSSVSRKSKKSKHTACTKNSNHSQACGNMGRWFNSQKDVKAYVDKEMKYWADLEESGKISREEYYKKCPSGYECWSCGYCGKWTGNFKY